MARVPKSSKLIDVLLATLRSVKRTHGEFLERERQYNKALGILGRQVLPTMPVWAGAVLLPSSLMKQAALVAARWNRLYALVPGQVELLTALVHDRHYLANRYTPGHVDMAQAIDQIFDGIACGDLVVGKDTPVYNGHWYFERVHGVAVGTLGTFSDWPPEAETGSMNGPEQYQLERERPLRNRRVFWTSNT